jgi:hypothetical protein
MTQEQKIIRAKVGLLELAKQLGNANNLQLMVLDLSSCENRTTLQRNCPIEPVGGVPLSSHTHPVPPDGLWEAHR